MPEMLPFSDDPAVVQQCHDGTTFTRDFWMEDQIGAMVGASVSEYIHARTILGQLGGTRPRHSYVMGPDDPGTYWNEALTSPGTNGWNPRGATYYYDPFLDDGANYANWIACGCPKHNQYGEWAHGGLPLGYVEETWVGPRDRNLNQPGWPGSVRRGRHRK